MAKKSENELVVQKTEMQLINESRPDYLQDLSPEEARKGTEGMNKVVRPSFVKIIQAMSSSDLKREYGEGAVLLVPDMMLLFKPDSNVAFVPCLWYQEWCKWAPLALKGIEPMIAERSFDPTSKVAIKASDSATWKEEHPKHPGDDKMCYRYQEHLNYVVKLVRDDLMDLPPVLLSFSKTNYRTGSMLNRIAIRRNAPLFSMQFLLGVKEKPNQKGGGSGTYWNFTVEDNKEALWAPKEVYNLASGLHDEFEQLIRDRALEANYDDADAVEGEEVKSANTY